MEEESEHEEYRQVSHEHEEETGMDLDDPVVGDARQQPDNEEEKKFEAHSETETEQESGAPANASSSQPAPQLSVSNEVNASQDRRQSGAEQEDQPGL